MPGQNVPNIPKAEIKQRDSYGRTKGQKYFWEIGNIWISKTTSIIYYDFYQK